jgi:hypothetical protein
MLQSKNTEAVVEHKGRDHACMFASVQVHYTFSFPCANYPVRDISVPHFRCIYNPVGHLFPLNSLLENFTKNYQAISVLV